MNSIDQGKRNSTSSDQNFELVEIFYVDSLDDAVMWCNQSLSKSTWNKKLFVHKLSLEIISGSAISKKRSIATLAKKVYIFNLFLFFVILRPQL